MSRFAELLHPMLRDVPPAARAAALREARREPFDVVELVGIAAALIVSALFARYALAHLLPAGPPLATFLIGLGGFAATVGPFLMRRTRRGLAAARGAAA